MPGYVMGVVNGVKDGPAFEAYQHVVEPTIGQYGGKRVFFSGEVTPLDGGWAPLGLILFEFESADPAKKWYNSPEYQAVVNQRINSTDSAVTLFVAE
ncbi:MAG: hypothetical protein BZY81_01590 [SAR202 cluster bacterium Io17-Chloro-G4]|nr:MAG: hypothetical protein BZY81_01590 [SAR202 cluster bacterium Io17-Chloro-G4]